MNYFEELEMAVVSFVKQSGLTRTKLTQSAILIQILEEKFHYQVISDESFKDKGLSEFRSLTIPGKQTLYYLNPTLKESQKCFQITRELGYSVLALKDRPHTSTIVRVKSFEEALNNFKASYFANALLMPYDEIVADLNKWFAHKNWNEEFLIKLIEKYKVSAETFLYRLCTVIPHEFGINNLFFLRFYNTKMKFSYELDKELHLGQMHSPLWSKSDSTEQNQAEIFVDIFKYEKLMDTTPLWKGIASIPDMESLLSNFLGEQRSKTAIQNFATRNNLDLNQSKADPKLVAYVERVLAGIIGSASARIMLASVVKEEEIKLAELLDILKESQQLMLLNRELKKAKDQLESANSRLKEIDELKDDFLATVTHELRTPITSIRAFSEILFDNPEIDLDERQQYLQIINKETDRLSRLISQVLDLEKYNSGKQKLNLALESVVNIVNESVDSIKQLAREKGIPLDIQIEIEDKSYLLDKDKIMQVLINLLSNAVKFTESPNGFILIGVKSLNQQIEFLVKDNGKGIQEEYQQLVFEKFFQARNQTIRKPKGSGLGLAICKKIVELHGGEISVLSESGKGATFVFTIPILKEES